MAERNQGPASLAAFVAWLEQAPSSTTFTAGNLAQTLAPLTENAQPSRDVDVQATWRERLWLVPPETRLGVAEAAEAFGRSKHWIYHRTAPTAGDRLPHKKLGDELQFVAGELRAWLRDHEETIAPGRMDPTPLTLHTRRAS